jgi:hypothetical protein
MGSVEIANIKKRLNDLAHLDTTFETFGSSAHRYLLNAPLSDLELEAFENNHAIILPDPYRTFISKIGNGGAGPYYGLFPLGFFDAAGGPLERWKAGDGFAGDLSEPFPHREMWSASEEWFEHSGRFKNDDEEDAWVRAFEDEVWNPELVNGAFPICHEGCAIRHLLIVTGPERGNVWIDDRANDGGIHPINKDSKTGAPFLEWYSGWIDRSTDALSR